MQPVIYMLRFSDGRAYVGAAHRLGERRRLHMKLLRKGRGVNRKVQQAFDDCGPPEVVVVASAIRQDDLHLLERAVIASLAPDLNVAKPTPLAKSRQREPRFRKWGPYGSIREAAAALNMSYTSAKRLTQRPYEEVMASIAASANRAEQRAAVEASRRAAGSAYVEGQKVLVDGVLDFPSRHCARLGISKDTYRSRRQAGKDPFTGGPTPMPTPPRLITALGKTQSLTEWALESGISKQTIACRLDQLGWAPDRAVSAPRRSPGQFLKDAARQAREADSSQ